MLSDGPIYRSPDEVAEISQAEHAGWKVIDSLDDDVKARLFALLEEVPRD